MCFCSVIYEVLLWLVLETVLLPTEGPKEQTQRGALKSPERQASPLAKITQYQLADWKGRAANSAERWALRWILKNRKETQRRTD